MIESDLNREYAEYDRGVRLNNVRITSMLVIVLVPFGALLDWFVYPALVIPFFCLRLICSVCTAVAWLLLESRWQKQVYPYLIHAWYLLPTMAMSLMIAWSEGIASPYYAGLNLVILAVSVVMQTSLKESLGTLGAIFALYTGACFMNGSWGNPAADFGNLYFLTVTATIVLLGNYNYNRLRYREFVLRHQLGESQRQLEKTNLQLRELDEAKSRFFANISHELRTPLTLIASPIEKLRKHAAIKREPDLDELVGIMESNSLRLLRMINNLLDLVRLEGNQSQIARNQVSIDEVLKGLLNSVEHVARTKDIRLKSDFDPDPGFVILDQDRVEKIVLNLLLNAVKFTPADGVVSLSWHVDNAQLVIEVKDSGIGIATENLEHIFNRFWQANTSSTRKFQGVGIGLSLVKELAESLGGRVTVESQLGEGTQFTVTLPCEEAKGKGTLPESPAYALEEEMPKADEWLVSLYRRADLFIDTDPAFFRVDHVELARRKRPLVLIGEDSPDMATFIASQLKDDFDLIVATDGQYAIDMTRQYKPDLLVLDLMMPEKDGLEVCRELEGEVKARGLPILVLTARADDETKLKVLQSGATDFMTKPFSSTELQTRCRNLVALALLGGRVAIQNQELRRSMEQIKESEVRMVQNAKMISLGRMSAGLIHEINNPLNYVTSAVQLLKRKSKSNADGSLDDIFADIDHGLKRVSDLVASLRTFSHPSPLQKQAVPLLKCIQQACRLTSPIDSPSIVPVVRVAADLAVEGNDTQLNQVLINLIQNAMDACASRPEPEIRIEAEQIEDRVVIRVIDNGTGIPAEILDKIFDPFFTTKDVGSGMGLGLSICHAIIKAHHGRLDFESDPQQGTIATIALPMVSTSLSSSTHNPASAENPDELLIRL